MTLARRLLIPGLLAGALLRAAAVTLPGTQDVGAWKIWTFAASTDATGVYGVGGEPPERRPLRWRGAVATTEYPPLAIYELALVGRLYWRLDPLFQDSPVLTALVKTPGIAWAVTFVAVLLTWGRRRFGDAAIWMALAFWLNPAVLLGGSVLGYLDAQMAVPAVLALLAAASGRGVAAGALAAAAVLTKAQALFALPAIGLALWHAAPDRTGRRRILLSALGGAAAAAAVILLPVALRGAWPNMTQAVGRLASHNMISGHAFNLWWIVTWIVRALDSLELGWWGAFTAEVRILRLTDFMRLYPNPKPLGAALVLGAIAWGFWRARRRPGLAPAALFGAWSVFAYVMLGVQVHENHLYLAVPLLLVAAGLRAEWRPLFWTVSAMAALNLYLFYGLGDSHPPWIGRRWSVVDLSVWLSFVNVGVFLWATRRLLAAAANGRVRSPDPG